MEKLGFEESDHLNGYSIYPDAAIDTELAKVYVERFTTPNTGDVIPNDHTGLSENGAYGPIYRGEEDLNDYCTFVSDFWDSRSNGTDIQILTIRAEAEIFNFIGNSNFEPYNSNHQYFPLNPGPQINVTTPGDISVDINGFIDQWGDTGLTQRNRLSPMFISLYEDDIRITAQMLGVDYDSRKKRTLWHEIGHTLGLSDNVNPSQGIMDQTGYSTQADIDRSRSLVINMMWTDIEATNVRRDYVSNID